MLGVERKPKKDNLSFHNRQTDLFLQYFPHPIHLHHRISLLLPFAVRTDIFQMLSQFAHPLFTSIVPSKQLSGVEQ